MSLIKSISGIRGTIGGKAGDNLTPIDIVQFTTAFVMFLRKDDRQKKLALIVGRDARISGDFTFGTSISFGHDGSSYLWSYGYLFYRSNE